MKIKVKVPLRERNETMNRALLWCHFLKEMWKECSSASTVGSRRRPRCDQAVDLKPGNATLTSATWRGRRGGCPQSAVSLKGRVESRLLRTASFYRTGSSLETPVIAPSRGSAEEVSERPRSHNQSSAAYFHSNQHTWHKISVKGPPEQFGLSTTLNKQTFIAPILLVSAKSSFFFKYFQQRLT